MGIKLCNLHSMANDLSYVHYFNPRTDGGGAVIRPPPPRFVPDSVKTAARSAAKFGMTIPTFIAHITRKF